jgi:hypothetical protein
MLSNSALSFGKYSFYTFDFVEESVTQAVVSGNVGSISAILSFKNEVFEFCIISELF